MNPIIAGFNPDPSIVRVDGVYYLVTSTFEYLPGLPVYRSTDLVEWEAIGHVASRESQLALGSVPTPGGVWAPTIRYRDGVFYVIVTVMFAEQGCVVFTATDPAGPWSEPLRLPAVDGIDPDLAWDDDGTAYVTFARHPVGILQVTVDLATGEALEQPREMWNGSGLYSPEGPHLYHRGDNWYLLVAEGGTERGHAVSVGRGSSPRGPFVGDPANPVLSARSSGEPVQNTGHADLVEAPDGSTAMVLLGVRPTGFTRTFSPLGRETFLTPVDWVDGWPRPRSIELGPPRSYSYAADFSDPAVLHDPEWIAVRRHPREVSMLVDDALAISADGHGIDHLGPAFVGQRQRHLTAAFSTRVHPGEGAGGIALRYSEQIWLAIEAAVVDGAIAVTATSSLPGLRSTWETTLSGESVELRIEAGPRRPAGGIPAIGGDGIRLIAGGTLIAELDGRYWSFETSQAFTGRVVGMYAARGAVRFSSFTYTGTDEA